ncbi:hypothetical protein [Paenibacillus sp. FSL H3-0333]|uniref:hypothetical protein n=1 Tax=Paenibacillus sp. FSL H3-0333 TaxID=2921373 RepID=UPI0030F890DB
MDTAWIGVIGGLCGSVAGIAVSTLNNRDQLKKEREARIWDAKRISEEREMKQRSDMFKVYNAFLNEDGNFQYVRENEDQRFKNFDRDRYKQVMRPLLIPDLHLLSNDVFKLVRKLDSYTYDDLNYIDHEEWYNDMANIYGELVMAIEKEYDQKL